MGKDRRSKMLVAAIQMNSRDNKEENIQAALRLIDVAAGKGARLAVLPEMFNFLGPGERRLQEAERIPGPTIQRMVEKAKEHRIYLIAGSILETSHTPDKVYNTSVLIDPEGQVVARYRKIHLFDVVVEGQPPYEESAYIFPGREVVAANIEGATIGMTICYDLRFPELYRALSSRGAQIISIPSAFTLHTGLAHWEALVRARAIENQSYVIASAQVGSHPINRECYGHSMIVDPWGTALGCAPNEEWVVAVEVDLEYLAKVRRNFPALSHRRQEIF
jgi:predicted amidohydrolase